MAAYCKLLVAVVAILLAFAAENQCARESVIQESILARQSAEDGFSNSFADERGGSYETISREMNHELDDGEEAYEEEAGGETDYPDNRELIKRGKGYDGEAEEEDYETGTESDQEEEYEEAVEQGINGIKLIKSALQYGLDKLRKLGNKLICSTIKRRISALQGKGKGTASTRGSVTEFTAKGSLPLGSLLPGRTQISIFIAFVSYDCSSYIFNIKLRTGTLTIIPNFMSLSRLSAIVTVSVTSPKTNFKLSVEGKWNIGRLSLSVSTTYDVSTGQTHVNVHPKPGSLVQFVQSITGLHLPVSPSKSASFQLNGVVASNGAVQLTLVSDKMANKFYAMYVRPKSGSPSTKLIAVEVQSFKLSTVLKALTRVDISSVPFFGSFTLPSMGFAYATGDLSNIPTNSLFKNSPLLRTLNGNFYKGFSAIIKVPFHNAPLLVMYRSNILEIKSRRNTPLKLNTIVSYLASGGGNWKVNIPSALSHIFNINIDIILIKQGVVTIKVSLPHPVVFFSNILSLSNVKASIMIQKRSPKVAAKFSGKIHLADGTFVTTLAPNRSNKYVLLAVGDNLSINTLFSRIGASFLPSALTTFLRRIPFLQFSIKKPTISYTFGVKPMQMHIGGIPVIGGYSVVDMDTLVTRIGGTVKAILGFKLGSTNFASLLKKITNFNFAMFPLLSQEIIASVTISPLSTRAVKFSGSIGSLSIKRGVTLRASMKFPRRCSDVFCKFGGILLGHNTVLSLEASISSATYFPISATVNNLYLGKGMLLGKAGIEIVGGASPKIGLVGELILSSPRLIFSARISAGTQGLTCALSMTNCWNHAFGVKWLDICNLLGSIDFAPPTGVTGLAIGAEIHLGYKSTGHQLRAKGVIGVSIISPVENFYYVKFNSLTMGGLLKAFKLSVNIPKPLAVSGFPEGFESSFSALGKELPEIHVSIPAGFHVKGKLNILGLQAFADITLKLPSLFDANIALPPIRVGNLLAMYASAHNTRRGPYLKAKIQTLPSISVNIMAQGYLKVLGISIQTKLVVTNTHYKFDFRANFLNLFKATLHISASYGNIRKASFQVRGVFEADLYNGIQNLVRNAVKRIGDVAKRGFNAAHAAQRKVVEGLERAKTAALNLVKSLTNKVSGLYKKIFIAKIMNHCSSHSCRETVTMQGWGRRFVRRVSRSVTRVVKRGWKYASSGLKNAYNSAKSTLNSAKNKVKDVIRRLNAARNILKHVVDRFKDGLKIFKYIIRHGLGAIISIQSITFSVGLAVASRGHFSCGVNVIFLGSSHHYGININFRSLSSVASNLKSKILSAFKSLG